MDDAAAAADKSRAPTCSPSSGAKISAPAQFVSEQLASHGLKNVFYITPFVPKLPGTHLNKVRGVVKVVQKVLVFS